METETFFGGLLTEAIEQLEKEGKIKKIDVEVTGRPSPSGRLGGDRP